MRILILSFAVCMAIFLVGCDNNHLIVDKNYRQKVENDFNERKILANNRKEELFSVFDDELSDSQEEALKFLFAYMPLSDLADYTGEFFRANSDIALRTKAEQRWGESIPEKLFLHYVLPLRVNNENLDSFRIAYYDEISSRIKGLDARQAALEINHWCHEKVTYQPSDIRTSGPMSTILSARGRCGEESTFTVAALRTAGLPARQVYTPRWAHSDDNHAWVEVWIDGMWYYMGACEPEPVLDRGWFTEPARRAMLVHTKSFGAPSGEENIIASERNFSIINCLSKYAATKRIYVKVLDSNKSPVENAIVEFKLYNYAEFYPLASIPTAKNGISSFETGLGDLMIWAHKGSDFGYLSVSVNEIDTITVVLDRKPESEGYYEYDLGVPVARIPFDGPSEEIIKANSIKLEKENKIRESYIESWMKPADAASLAESAGVETAIVQDLIRRSMGNYNAVSSFIRKAPVDDKKLALKLLTLISDKDLRDTPEPVLSDHLIHAFRYENAGKAYDEETYYKYVLNPRIANELIVAWRNYLFNSMDITLRQNALINPSLLADYVNNRITVNDTDNYYGTPVTPIGVDKLRTSDRFSRDIYFVALCRSLGIPSRLEAGSNRPQFFSLNEWHDAIFDNSGNEPLVKGFLRLVSNEKQPVPEYYIHFTVARFDDGRYKTLEYDYNRKITDFNEELELLPGFYMLITGNRISDSRILSSITFFELKSNEHKIVEVVLRRDKSPLEVLGKIDLASDINLSGIGKKKLEELAGNGLVMIWIEPDKEPSKHVLNDLPLLKTELDRWGGWFVFLLPSSEELADFQSASNKGLPENSIFVTDENSGFLKKICGAISCSSSRLPLVILINRDGEIIFRSEGYTIGIGEQILKKVE